MVRLIVALLLLLPAGSLRAQVDAHALECGTSATYYPRGDHWAVVPPAEDNRIIIRYQEDGPEQSDITVSTAADAVNDAFNKWLTVDCFGSGKTPNISMQDGYAVFDADYPTRDRGESYDDDGELLTAIDDMQNIIYWVKNESERPTGLDSGTVGLTTNLHFNDSGFVVTGDMEFNGIDYQWRTGSSGCTAGANDCYDIHAVALHEAGHFFGFDHVQCADAVMYPEGSANNQISEMSVHEQTAICTIYPPRVSGSYDRFTGEQCTKGTDTCPENHACVVDGAAEAGYGWCAQTCSTTDDCDAGFVCCNGSLEDCGAVPFCKPGVNDTGAVAADSADDDGIAIDLCAPCSDGPDCSSGLCVHDDQGNQICSQSCVNSDDLGSTCPSGFSCLAADDNTSVCWPDDITMCGGSNTSLISKNDVCYLGYNPGSVDDDAYGMCAGGLVCFLFRLRCYDYNNPASTGQEGNCVEYCNAYDKPCANPDHTCCFGIDESGNCNTDTSILEHGGCFDLRQENESCVTSEKSICSGDAGCFYLDAPQNSKCYELCSSVADCRPGQSCNTYSDGCNSFSLCEPPMDVNLAEIGQACNVNADCDSGDCLRYGGQAACTSSCNVVTAEGCPELDLDEDGENDAFECLILSGEGKCWRSDGPYVEPSAPEPPSSSGCSCDVGESTGFEQVALNLLVVALLALMMRRRRRRFAD
ncbi:MAG: hypothetical protein CMH60_07710 [Myxococcales bacterium]|nr:hypothetical protein [Myxococcales bacterium]